MAFFIQYAVFKWFVFLLYTQFYSIHTANARFMKLAQSIHPDSNV